MKYAAIQKRTIIIPGDERSRTHPGHGYPERTEESIVFTEFRTKAEMEEWAKNRIERHRDNDFRLIQFDELKVETTITVTVK